MSEIIITVIKLIKDAEKISKTADGSQKKAFVCKMIITIIGIDKYTKYEFFILELIDSLIWMNNNKDIKLFINKNCSLCIS